MRVAGKLLVSLGATVLIATVVISLLLVTWLERRGLEEGRRDVHRSATLVADLAERVLRAGPSNELLGRLTVLDEQTATRFTVIRADGSVVADSRRDPEGMDDHGDRPEILEAQQKGEGSALRESDTLETRLLYVALRIDDDDGRPLGYVRAALVLSHLEAQAAEIRGVAFASAAFGLLLVALIGVPVSRRLTRPLTTMTHAARSLAEGKGPPLALRLDGDDELSELAEAFSTMADQLSERMATIEAERARLAAILGSMSEGLIAVDARGRVVHMNEVAARVLETDSKTALGLRVEDVTRLAHLGDVLQTTLETGEPVSEELCLDGAAEERNMVLRATPSLDPSGVLNGAVLVLVDQTEVRRLERVRRDFVGNVSHELKTPLTALLAQLETLLEVPDMDLADRQRFLERSLRQGKRLSTLVADLLALSRIESTDTRQGFEDVDLRAPLRASVDNLRDRAQSKSLALELHLPSEPLLVRGDAEYLRQIADNLLSNAIMYTPEGGSIDLSLERQGEQALFQVRDTGIGVPRQERARIFERFYRVDQARSRDLGGTGLGLAIVKHLVLAHSGTVEVEGSVGCGTTFTVVLPLAA